MVSGIWGSFDSLAFSCGFLVIFRCFFVNSWIVLWDFFNSLTILCSIMKFFKILATFWKEFFWSLQFYPPSSLLDCQCCSCWIEMIFFSLFKFWNVFIDRTNCARNTPSTVRKLIMSSMCTYKILFIYKNETKRKKMINS